MEPLPSFALWIWGRRKVPDSTYSALIQLAGCLSATIERPDAEQRCHSLRMATLPAEALENPEGKRAGFPQFGRGKLIPDRLPYILASAKGVVNSPDSRASENRI